MLPPLRPYSVLWARAGGCTIAPSHHFTQDLEDFLTTGLHNNNLLQHWHTSHWILYYSASAKLCILTLCNAAAWRLLRTDESVLGSTLHPLWLSY